MQSRVDAYKFSFFPKNCYRMELPSQLSQINTIYGFLQDFPTYQQSYWICLCVTVTLHFCSVS